MLNPIEQAKGLVNAFKSDDEREVMVSKELGRLLEKQKIDPETGEISGPRIGAVPVARGAGIPRNLVNQSTSELTEARKLLISVLAVLKDGSLEARCEYLQSEVERLDKQLRYQISANAGLLLQLKKAVAAGAVPNGGTRGKATAEQVRAAINIIPIEMALVAKKQQD